MCWSRQVHPQTAMQAIEMSCFRLYRVSFLQCCKIGETSRKKKLPIYQTFYPQSMTFFCALCCCFFLARLVCCLRESSVSLRGSEMPASPPPPLNCTPTSPDVSLLRSKLQRQVSKVCRYRHHIINYQTFLSCHKTPVGFSSRSVITHPLDDEEKLRLKELHQSFSTGLTLLALKSAKRHFCQAQDTLSKLLEDSRSRLNKAHSHQLAVAIQCYGARLDEELTARRLKKWQKNGICPKPLRLSGRLELGITKTKRQRRSTRRKKAKGGNSKDTAPTNKKTPLQRRQKDETPTRIEEARYRRLCGTDQAPARRQNRLQHFQDRSHAARNVSAQERTDVLSGNPLPQSCSTGGGSTRILPSPSFAGLLCGCTASRTVGDFSP